MSLVTVNNKIAVEPFPTTEAKTEVVNGRVVMKQYQELTPLKVVFDAYALAKAGQTVFVRGDLCKHQLAKQVFEYEGKQFILIDNTMMVGFLKEQS